MQTKYPFLPLSNARLQTGDYWTIQRDDGYFGFFAFLYPWSEGRTGMIVALLDYVSSTSQLNPARVDIHSVGITTTRTFKALGTEVIGNLENKLDLAECEAWREEFNTRSTVWGYMILSKLVNSVRNQLP